MFKQFYMTLCVFQVNYIYRPEKQTVYRFITSYAVLEDMHIMEYAKKARILCTRIFRL